MKRNEKGARFGQRFVDPDGCTLSPRKEKRARIRYQRWVNESYGVPEGEWTHKGWPVYSEPGQEPQEDESIDLEVRKAVARLRPDEKLFVELFYFEFRSYGDIARKMKRKVHKLERINQRVRGKLGLLLGDFVKKRFGVVVPPVTDCAICNSSSRVAIDQLIRDKKDEETYSRLMSTLRHEYGLDIRTPQVIIGHRRKHMV